MTVEESRQTPFHRLWWWCMYETDKYTEVTGFFGESMATERLWMTYEEWQDIVISWDVMLMGMQVIPKYGTHCMVDYSTGQPIRFGRYEIVVATAAAKERLNGMLWWDSDYDLRDDDPSGSVAGVSNAEHVPEEEA